MKTIVENNLQWPTRNSVLQLEFHMVAPHLREVSSKKKPSVDTIRARQIAAVKRA